MKTQSKVHIILIAVLALACLWVGAKDVPGAAAQSSGAAPAVEQSGNKTYLPVIMKVATSGGGGGGGGGGNQGQTGAVWLPYTLTDGSILPTYGTSVAVDGNGGIHVAFAIYSGTDEQGQQPATYAYCAAQCAEKANWSYTHLGDDVQEVRLALAPGGHPRMILYGPVYDPTWPRMRYQYAACDSGCTSKANWTITTIATPIEPTATREYDNSRYFAVDKQGRPAFIYTDTIQNDHPGTFYMSCQTNCTNAYQWTETTLTSNTLFDKPSLAFSPSGQPRLALGLFDAEANLYLSYTQCDANCTDGANWVGTTLVQIHGTAKYNLSVDSNGRPRMGVYTGSYSYNPFQSQRLLYLWCDSNCSSAQGWYFSDIGLSNGTGDGVDMALDGQNRPRMSFETASQGLGYAWCDTDCQSDNGVWQSREAETQASLADNYEVLPIRRCTVSTWFNGQRSSLALDPDGNPRIAYDAQHWWYGTEDVGGVPHQCNYQDVTVTRVALFDKP